MLLSPEDEKRNEQQFDSYCKKVLRNYARDILRARHNLEKHEITFSELPETITNSFHVFDRYEAEENLLEALGYKVPIGNDCIFEALKVLPEKKRMIILLFYFLGFTDSEIGTYLNSVRSTVQSTRARTLKELKKYIERN